MAAHYNIENPFRFNFFSFLFYKVRRTPPTIYSPNQRVMSVGEGEPFKLECTAHGHPTPSIRIETPNRPRAVAASAAAPAPLRNRVLPQVKTELSYFTRENAGDYLCIAENELGEQAVERFTVTLRESGEPPFINVEPKLIESPEGSSLIINYTYTVRRLNELFFLYQKFEAIYSCAELH